MYLELTIFYRHFFIELLYYEVDTIFILQIEKQIYRSKVIYLRAAS